MEEDAVSKIVQDAIRELKKEINVEIEKVREENRNKKGDRAPKRGKWKTKKTDGRDE